MEMEKTFDKLRDIIKTEMDAIVAKGELDENSLHCVDKMVDILKDMDEMEGRESGYSQAYMPMYAYGNSMNSYRNNGQSNAYRGGSSSSYRGGNSYRNSYNDGYSRAGDAMDRLQRMMDEAQTEQERQAIRRVMETM